MRFVTSAVQRQGKVTIDSLVRGYGRWRSIHRSIIPPRLTL
jgi:hypothetical protein